MNLPNYLFHNKLSATEFAKMCDLSSSYVCMLLRGVAKPSKKTLRIFARVTNGRVTKVVPLPDPKPHHEEERKAG